MFESCNALDKVIINPMSIEDFVKLWESGKYFRKISCDIPYDGTGLGFSSRAIEGLFQNVVLYGKGVRIWVSPERIKIEKDGKVAEASVDEIFKLLTSKF